MSDIIDQANDNIERDTALAIEAARRPVQAEPVACGRCYNCEESLPGATCFCDADCRDDWQARRAAGR